MTLRVPVDQLATGTFTLSAEASRYVTRVHRAAVGDAVVLFDPDAATEARALIIADRPVVRLEVPAVVPAPQLPGPEVWLVHALGKGDRTDQVVRDATALGVHRLYLFAAERSQLPADTRRTARWRTIAREAARQSGRGDLPRLIGPGDLAEQLQLLEPSERLCLDPRAELSLGRSLANWDATRPIALLFGPEGGLTDAEVVAAKEHGFRDVSFGQLVLRMETAATAVLGAVRGELGRRG